MSETSRLVDELEREHAGDPWHGSSVTDILKGVTAAQAAAHIVPHVHTIWQVVLHMTAWKNEVRHRLSGAPSGTPEEGDWPEVGAATPERWRDALWPDGLPTPSSKPPCAACPSRSSSSRRTIPAVAKREAASRSTCCCMDSRSTTRITRGSWRCSSKSFEFFRVPEVRGVRGVLEVPGVPGVPEVPGVPGVRWCRNRLVH